MRLNIEAIKHLLALAEAENAGKTIQRRGINQWNTIPLAAYRKVCLDFPDQFRVKPEPKLRPWTHEEVPVGKVLVHKQDRSWKRLIVACSSEGLWAGSTKALISFYEALEQYTLADGSPCGTEEAQ